MIENVLLDGLNTFDLISQPQPSTESPRAKRRASFEVSVQSSNQNEEDGPMTKILPRVR